MPISKQKQYRGIINQQDEEFHQNQYQQQQQQQQQNHHQQKHRNRNQNQNQNHSIQKSKLNKIKNKKINYRSVQDIEQESERNFWIVFSLSTLMVILCWIGSNYIGQPYIHANTKIIYQNPNSQQSLNQAHKQGSYQKKNEEFVPKQNVDTNIGQKTNQLTSTEDQALQKQREVRQGLNTKQDIIKSYRYGDSIDFVQLKKRDRYIKETLLKQENLEYAARFFNMLGRDISNNEQLKNTYKLQIEYYDRKYKINQYKQQIEICVIIYGHQNQFNNRYRASLDSVFQQDYQNYQVHYVADGSPRTGDLVSLYMNQNPNYAKKMTFINYEVRRGKSRVLYEIGHQYCKPGTIMYPLDGADNLIGRQVFKLMNAIYQDKNAKFVYMNFLEFYTEYEELMLAAGYSRQVPSYVKTNRIYRQRATPLNLRSWASDLFLAIPEEDYKFQGLFVPIGDDLMIMYTLQELAGENVQYVPQIVYFYNGDIQIDEQQQDIKQKIVRHAKGRQKFQPYTKQILWRVLMPTQKPN